jgi:hypothetical protein
MCAAHVTGPVETIYYEELGNAGRGLSVSVWARRVGWSWRGEERGKEGAQPARYLHSTCLPVWKWTCLADGENAGRWKLHLECGAKDEEEARARLVSWSRAQAGQDWAWTWTWTWPGGAPEREVHAPSAGGVVASGDRTVELVYESIAQYLLGPEEACCSGTGWLDRRAPHQQRSANSHPLPPGSRPGVAAR